MKRRRRIKKALPLNLSYEALRPDPLVNVHEWAEKHRVLDGFQGSTTGPWRTAFTPYLREIMETFTDPNVREIVVMSSTQVGKTELILNCLGYIITMDPAPIMVVLPKDPDCKKWGTTRLKRMVVACPALLRETTGLEDDLAGKLWEFKRCFLRFASSNSPSDLASDPIRFLFFDECDKYPSFVGREADPISLGKERTRTYYDHKIIKVSTPTSERGIISREYERSDRRTFHVPCPHCGTYQRLAFRKAEGTGWVRFPADKDGDEIERRHLAWYECVKGCRIEEHEKTPMVRRGVWCPEGCSVDKDGIVQGQQPKSYVRGFWMNALYSPHFTFSKIVHEFLIAHEDNMKMQGFINGVLAEPFKEVAKHTSEAAVKKRALPYEKGTVPADAKLVTMGIDVQDTGMYFVVRAWGNDQKNWLVRWGFVETWDELILEINVMYRRAGTVGHASVSLACIDSGHRTDEVYAFCQKYRERVIPMKGASHAMNTPYKRSELETNAAGKPIPGLLGLIMQNTQYYKDKLFRHMNTPDGEMGEFHVYEGIDDVYCLQVTSEEKRALRDKRGRQTYQWEKVTESRENHLWDCELYALLAADLLKVHTLRKPDEPRVHKADEHDDPRERPWIPRKKDWLKG